MLLHQNHNILGFMVAIGAIIKNRRKEFGLTQAQLAELAGVGINRTESEV